MSLITSKQERVRFLKFVFVGITGAVVDFGILNLLRLVLGVPLIWAQGISFTAAVLNNFLWNRYWTYPDSRSKKTSHQLFQFFIINLIGIIIRTPLISWLDRLVFNILEHLAWDLPIENYILSYNLALTISIGIVMLWNYFANRYWTYNDVPGNENPTDPADQQDEEG
jgi:putative flippase GtrA